MFSTGILLPVVGVNWIAFHSCRAAPSCWRFTAGSHVIQRTVVQAMVDPQDPLQFGGTSVHAGQALITGAKVLWRSSWAAWRCVRGRFTLNSVPLAMLLFFLRQVRKSEQKCVHLGKLLFLPVGKGITNPRLPNCSDWVVAFQVSTITSHLSILWSLLPCPKIHS